MGLRKDIWRTGIVRASIDEILDRGTLAGFAVHWFPETAPYTFVADPFGLWRNDRLHVFVEAYDYRTRRGSIEVFVYDASLELIDRRTVLNESWHLSYPVVFEADGETWMLPEAHKSSGLTLYRATNFPHEWEPAQRIRLGNVPIDATPVHYDGLWWLFYTVADTAFDKMGALHCAFAHNLMGPWTPHAMNPVRRGLDRSRPGGAAIVRDGRIVLPVQDCSRTYGGGLSALHIAVSPTTIAFDTGPRFEPPQAFQPYVEGLHTMSAAGPVTLIDAKRTTLSARGLGIEVRREWSKLRRG